MMTWNACHDSSLMDIQFPQSARPSNTDDAIMNLSPAMETNDDATLLNGRDLHENSLARAKSGMDTITEEEEHESSSEDGEKPILSFYDVYLMLAKKVQSELDSEEKMSQLVGKKDYEEERFSMITSSRGLEDPEMEELRQGLERFKIRTLDPNGGAIVKNDSK